MAVGGEEFLRRFLLHVLPRGFVPHPLLRIPCESAANPTTATLQQLLEAISHQSLPAPQAGETKLPASWCVRTAVAQCS